ncbi:caspase family protein [Alphaproteobacteria bacterium KMM 3653]|uniref:Caspase family protein n=1 Tax=Harenicola maris TaxID=2841044 RepID=A0AAP2G8A8_9RHOB|nr:caspase family protein [Harenicola maris]
MLVICGFAAAAVAQSGQGVALVIGIGGYAKAPLLPNAQADAHLVAQAFSQLGFRTTLHMDLSHDGVLAALQEFRQTSGQAEIAVIYFAGHGITRDGQGLLFGRDADLGGQSNTAADTGVPLDLLVWAASNIPRQKLLFIDACRDTPDFDRARAGESQSGLQSSGPLPAGTYIGYAAQAGAAAMDGPVGGNGPFAAALAQMLGQGELEIEDLMRRVRISVIRQSGGLQVPWSQSSLLLPVYLGAAPNIGAVTGH